MLFVTSALLVLTALTASAYPNLSPGWTHHVEPSNPKREVTHHVEYPVNVTFAPRAAKGVCKTLDLPTAEQYKLGYETFCNNYVPDNQPKAIGDDDLVVTVLLKNYQGVDIPWIYKVSSELWSGSVKKRTYFLNRSVCLEKFRQVLEGPDANVGGEYCLVEGSGGEGDSKGFSGQGVVLVNGGTVHDYPGGRKASSSSGAFETRKRKGEFDPAKERAKGN